MTTQEQKTLEVLGRIIAETIWNDIQKTIANEKKSREPNLSAIALSDSGTVRSGNNGDDRTADRGAGDGGEIPVVPIEAPLSETEKYKLMLNKIL